MRNERRDLAWVLWRGDRRAALAGAGTTAGESKKHSSVWTRIRWRWRMCRCGRSWARRRCSRCWIWRFLRRMAALRVRARVDLTSASVPVQVEAVARAEDAKEMQKYAAYFSEKGLVRLSAGLVPELGEDDLDALAERLLAAYYPEALEKPRRVDAHEMAERMGLSVLYRQNRAGRRDLRRDVLPGDGDTAL